MYQNQYCTVCHCTQKFNVTNGIFTCTKCNTATAKSNTPPTRDLIGNPFVAFRVNFDLDS